MTSRKTMIKAPIIRSSPDREGLVPKQAVFSMRDGRAIYFQIRKKGAKTEKKSATIILIS
jgi:hypothetical protein